jgi:hypothetical protein
MSKRSKRGTTFGWTTDPEVLADLAALVSRAAVQIQPSDVFVIDADEHVSDESVGGQRTRIVLVLPRALATSGKRK